MFFFPVYRTRHSCVPLPIDKQFIKNIYRHCENAAGYDIFEVTAKLPQCPICDSTYSYDPVESKIGVISYNEFENV